MEQESISKENINILNRYHLMQLLVSKLNNIGIALSIEKNISILLEKILMAAKEITMAEGGTIYIFNKEDRTLRFEIMLNDVLKTHYGGSGKIAPPFEPLAIFDSNNKVNENMISAYCAGYRTKVNIKDAYEEVGFDFSGTKKFDKKTGYRSRSFLTVPMLDAKNSLLGVLQLINPHNQDQTDRTFDEFDEEMVESLTSQASIALSNRLLLDETINLFEAMINMINVALDEKSHYTNEHCQKVPIITMMLAEAAIDSDHSCLKKFNLTEEQKYELRIASLLHDCGKIVTPTHIIDKSKKLELLSNKFELITTRASIIKKEIEIEYLQKGVEDQKSKLQKINALKKDLIFIKECNNGRKNLEEIEIKRLKLIYKKWHYHEDGKIKKLLTKDELNYLSVPIGTLSKKERQIVNDHVVHSIKMLESLPWPEYLKRVPEYAGGHHERIDGKGYPKGIKGTHMAIPTKIMAIADVFEALTSDIRPYKDPVNLSKSLTIMDKFVKDGHLDPDLYKVFIEKKIYLTYAKKYMNPSKIDID